MNGCILFLLSYLWGLNIVICDKIDPYYEVVGVECKPNEEVSCLLIKCPTGRYCPAENFCYNPKCVCRKGYRRVRGDCVQKHAKSYWSSDEINLALLKTDFGNPNL